MPCSNGSAPDWGEVCLVGGGPSLRGFPFERLKGRTVVAINDAMLYLPWAAAVFSIDLRWMENRVAELAGFAGEKYLAIPEGHPGFPVLGATWLRRLPRYGFSDDPEAIVCAGNGGYGALNLAYLKGARTIYLLGYDFCHSSVRWHRGYDWQGAGNDRMYDKWAKRFIDALPYLKAKGVCVYNASLGSRITAFPKISLEDLIQKKGTE
jgi:hypothetical protein